MRISKVWPLGLLCWLVGGSLALGQTSQPALHRCATDERERLLRERNPLRSTQFQRLNQLVDSHLEKAVFGQPNGRIGETVYRIPVVVHVIHSNASGVIGGPDNPNISEEQIKSQIRVLNEDYRRLPGTRGFNDNPVGADTGIEFFLAQVDPSGKPTNGITRHFYTRQTTFDVYDDDLLLSQIAYWPSDRYLNIWVAPLASRSGTEYLGYSQFPTAPITPFEAESDERTDGVMIDYRTFGSEIGTVNQRPAYRLGRSTTHEVAHWLGLLHTWGDAFCGDDYCADTPPTESPNNTFECTERFSNCSGTRTRNQIENYLDYSPDACMNLFTRNQRARMRAILEVSPRRKRLIQSVNPLPQPEALTVNLYPNPTSDVATLEVFFSGFRSFSVTVYDLLGRQYRNLQYADYPSTSLTIPVRSLPNGLYLVKVLAGSETVTRRLLIQGK